MDKRTAKRMAKQLEEKAILDAERRSIRLKEDSTLILYDNGRLFDEKTNKFCLVSKIKDKISVYTGLNTNVQRRERLVADNFVFNNDPDNKTFIWHKNGDKTDDESGNLEWVTKEQYLDLTCKDFLEEFSKNNPDIEFKEYSLNPFYIIFNDGRIFSKYQSKFMKPFIQYGYYTTGFSMNNNHKYIAVHRIIAEIFVENTNPDKYRIVDHKDRNPLNNHYTNLRWCDYSINNSNKDFKAIIKRKVNQFDLEGNFITSYNGVDEARNLTQTSNEISRCLCGKIPYANSYQDGKITKFIWKYDDESVLLKYEIPENSVPIKEFNLYWITINGQVYSEISKKFMKLALVGGYYMVTLTKEKKRYQFLVHRLVCEHFTPNKPDNYEQLCVNHIDGSKLNNNINNLEFITLKENVRHSIDILGNNTKKIICEDIITGEILKFKTVNDTANYFNIRNCNISSIIKRKGLYKKRYRLSYDTQ